MIKNASTLIIIPETTPTYQRVNEYGQWTYQCKAKLTLICTV